MLWALGIIFVFPPLMQGKRRLAVYIEGIFERDDENSGP
jgi:hypothetical protein